MSRLSKAMILVGLAVAIFGGGAFAAYFLFFKKPDYLTSKSSRPVGAGAPDPGITLFDQATHELNSGDEASCRKTLAALFESFPKSVKAEEAKKLLGDMVIREYFSPGPDKTVYTVIRGDSIRRIAQKTKASVELIFKANSLDSLTLHPGQRLIIPHAQFSLVINNKKQDVTILNRGEFFTWYKPLQFRV
ncbi:MAG: LysM peptidoglycan-binding domain-containing protein, partial [Verrucomicrobia bacterium]|nr:LysM peptidoglycan-binding domain-containing protein [Verrucomicrobiota bacterium]